MQNPINYHHLPVNFSIPVGECEMCSGHLVNPNSNSQSYVCEQCLEQKVKQQLEIMNQLRNELKLKKEKFLEYRRGYITVGNVKITNPNHREYRLRQQQMILRDLEEQIQQLKDANNEQQILNLQLADYCSKRDSLLNEAINALKKSTKNRKDATSRPKLQPIMQIEPDSDMNKKLILMRRNLCLALFKSLPIYLRPREEIVGQEELEVDPIDKKKGIYKLYFIHDELWIPVLLPFLNQQVNNRAPNQSERCSSIGTNNVHTCNNNSNTSKIDLNLKVLTHKDVASEMVNFLGDDKELFGKCFGYICLILNTVANYLNVPLKNKMEYYGSNSTILENGNKNLVYPLYYTGNSMNQSEKTLFATSMKEHSFTNMLDLFANALKLLNENIVALCVAQGLTISPFHANNFGYNLLCLYKTPKIGQAGPFVYYIPKTKDLLKNGMPIIYERDTYEDNYFIGEKDSVKYMTPYIAAMIAPKKKKESEISRPLVQLANGLIGAFIKEDYFASSIMK